jgi:hypothetical protein
VGNQSSHSVSEVAPDLFIEIMDEYYEDPYEVRSFALQSEFARPFTGTWSGLHSLRRHPRTAEVFQDLASFLPVDGIPNWREIEESFMFWGRPSAGVFALLLDGQYDSVHSHKRTGRWAAVCYLSSPSACAGRDGLSFFRHRLSGVTSCAGASADALETYRADAFDPSRWELLESVQMAFNRMVLFDGRFFHAASQGFGCDPQTARLTQLFAIDVLTEGTK